MRTKYQWGKGFTFCTVLRTAGSADIKANPTLASGDVKISKDGGSFSDIATLPSVSPSGGVRVSVTISDSEAQAKEIIIAFIDQTNPKEWDDQILILSAFDAREGRVNYPAPSAMSDRSGPVSAIISKSSKPSYTLIHTSHSSSSQYDFDTRLLIGAVLHDEEKGSDFVILGGYWFDDNGDYTRSVFGVAKDLSLFGCTEGGTTTPYTAGWTNAANEATYGNGWTFICAKSAQPISVDGDALEIYIDPNMIAEHQVSNMLDLRRISCINDLGDAFSAIATGANGNGMNLAGHGAGSGINAQGTIGLKAVGSGDSTSAGILAAGILAGIRGQGVGATGDGILAEGTGDGLKAVGGTTGQDINAKEIGVPVDLDGSGASMAGNAKDIFDNLSGSTLTAEEIADAVWDEAQGDHIAEGSTGKSLQVAGAGGDPSTIADAVWDEAIAGHIGEGSVGKTLSDTLTGVNNIKTILPSEAMPSLTDMKNLLYKKTVSARHDNDKPKTIVVGAGASEITVTTTQDANGNTQTESFA